MKVAIVQNPEEGSRLAASIFIDQVKQNPKTVLGLATGSTPVKMYKLLAEACKAGTVSFKDCQSFNLDEYLGLAPEHDQSYHYFMKTQLFDHIDIDQAKTHVPDGLSLRRRHQGRRRHRHPAPRHRLRRPHRLQRARLLPCLPHP